jgi:hypothetical protein
MSISHIIITIFCITVILYIGYKILEVIVNPFLPKFACKIFKWHVQPKNVLFDEKIKTYTGLCARCNKKVSLINGNWKEEE